MYCAYVTKIRNLRKHTNADRLLCGECFGSTLIVALGTEPGQLGVYFSVDGKLGVEFAQKNDLLRRRDENGDPAGGYLNPEKRNIKALKLRGEKSDGLFLPVSCMEGFIDTSSLKEGDTISVVNGIIERNAFQPHACFKAAGARQIFAGNQQAERIEGVGIFLTVFQQDNFRVKTGGPYTLLPELPERESGSRFPDRSPDWWDPFRRKRTAAGYPRADRRERLDSPTGNPATDTWQLCGSASPYPWTWW